MPLSRGEQEYKLIYLFRNYYLHSPRDKNRIDVKYRFILNQSKSTRLVDYRLTDAPLIDCRLIDAALIDCPLTDAALIDYRLIDAVLIDYRPHLFSAHRNIFSLISSLFKNEILFIHYSHIVAFRLQCVKMVMNILHMNKTENERKQ